MSPLFLKLNYPTYFYVEQFFFSILDSYLWYNIELAWVEQRYTSIIKTNEYF